MRGSQKALEKSKIREVFFFLACYTDEVTATRMLFIELKNRKDVRRTYAINP